MHTRVKNVLENNSISYHVIRHSDLGEIKSANDFAKASGATMSQIVKTLFVKSHHNKGYGMAILPSASRANLKEIATLLGFQSVELASPDELAEVTGYKKYGTTAIGTDLPTIIHEEILNEKEVYTATGETGDELKLAPRDLVRITHAKVADIVKK